MTELLARQHPFQPEVVHIPAGEFIMGSDPDQDKQAKEDELPQHTLTLPDYALGKTPVTNDQYSAFLKATGHAPPPHWKILIIKHRFPPRGRGDFPVVNVTWHDARTYCKWLSEATGKPYRLPNEPEWEKAARGTDGRLYPWGNDWDTGRCNTFDENGKEATTPVGAYPEGASPYGALDMIGNVWEWTSSLWGSSLRKPAFTYPYDPHDGRENPEAASDVRRVLRGVSFFNERDAARCAARYRYSPRNRYVSVGFRVLLDLSPNRTADTG
jgi:formylglycine-generating enzyme required for sulfatase activity